MSGSGRIVWNFFAGRRRKNRVEVFTNVGCRVCMMMWSEGGRQIVKSLKHSNKERAKAEAMEKAAELLAKAPRTHRAPDVLVAMRSDLVRCAGLQGLPSGVAPGFDFYEQHGRFETHAIQAAFKGWRGKDPRESWRDALAKFGFMTKRDAVKVTTALCAADVRRVAMLVGNPRRLPPARVYQEHGRYHMRTVLQYFGLTGWVDLADVLELDVEPHRRSHAAWVRANNPRHRTHTPEQQGSRTGRAA